MHCSSFLHAEGSPGTKNASETGLSDRNPLASIDAKQQNKQRGGTGRSDAHLGDFRRGVGVVWATVQNMQEYLELRAGQPRCEGSGDGDRGRGGGQKRKETIKTGRSGRYACARRSSRAAAMARRAAVQDPEIVSCFPPPVIRTVPGFSDEHTNPIQAM